MKPMISVSASVTFVFATTRDAMDCWEQKSIKGSQAVLYRARRLLIDMNGSGTLMQGHHYSEMLLTLLEESLILFFLSLIHQYFAIR